MTEKSEVTNSVDTGVSVAQTRAQAAAIQFMQQMLAFGEGSEHYRLAINALRRSGDHSAIQAKLADKDETINRMQGLLETCDVSAESLRAQLAEAQQEDARLTAEVFRMGIELAEAERDARRYRWLRTRLTSETLEELTHRWPCSDEETDAAIDAALERTTPPADPRPGPARER